MRIFFSKWFVLAIFIIIGASFYGQERVVKYACNVQIEKSGDFKVTEDITINAEGGVFEHGLLRFFPLTRDDVNGNTVGVEYELLSVKRNGEIEKYFTKTEGDVWKIYIGDADNYLYDGVYTYSLNYIVPYQVGYFDDYDEIYWNVTGNGWTVGIDTVTCTISLPEGGVFKNHSCYTGVKGSTASNCQYSIADDGRNVFFESYGLLPNEGLTVSSSFPKGVVNSPSMYRKGLYFYRMIKDYFWSLLYSLGISALLYFDWKKHGKDTELKTIIPEFRPPFDWSPAKIGYIFNRKFNDSLYPASIINIAVKGGLKITGAIDESSSSGNETYSFEINDIDPDVLASEELAAYECLSDEDVIEVSGENYEYFAKTEIAWYEDLIDNTILEDIYVNNTRKKLIAVAIALVLGLIYTALVGSDKGFGAMFCLALAISIGLIALGYYMIDVSSENSGGSCLFSVVSGSVLLFAGFPIIVSLFYSASVVQFIAIVAVIIAVVLHNGSIRRFTKEGADIYNRIEGFKLYLEAAEKDIINELNPPEMTPEVFEEFLPYAIALDVEISWGRRFESVLQDASYEPKWYVSSYDFDYENPTNFTPNIYSSLKSAKYDPSYSSPSSSSSSGSSGGSGSWSSGSSGGGSSGGGGGGGGGGGW